MIGAVVAVDSMIANQRLRQVQSLDRQVEQLACIARPDLGGERRLTRGEAEDGLAAAAPRCSVADLVRLEQGDFEASFRQVQRRRASGDAAADDANVGTVLTSQGLARAPSGFALRWAGGVGVIGGGGRFR